MSFRKAGLFGSFVILFCLFFIFCFCCLFVFSISSKNGFVYFFFSLKNIPRRNCWLERYHLEYRQHFLIRTDWEFCSSSLIPKVVWISENLCYNSLFLCRSWMQLSLAAACTLARRVFWWVATSSTRLISESTQWEVSTGIVAHLASLKCSWYDTI